MAVDIRVINENTWVMLNEGFVRLFLLEGDEDALVIDSGANFPDIIEIVEQLTEKPYKLILTHADGDHCSGTDLFETFYMNSAEAAHYYKHSKKNNEYIPVCDGDIIDLGNRPVKIISIPGHTPGSIALLDVNNRILYGGDSIQDGEIFMFGEYRDLHAYCHSLKKLDAFRDSFDLVYASHGTLEMPPSQIDKLYDSARGIINGDYKAADGEMFGTKISIYRTDCATFLMDRAD